MAEEQANGAGLIHEEENNSAMLELRIAFILKSRSNHEPSRK